MVSCKKFCCPCCSWKVKAGVLIGLGSLLIIAGVVLSAYGLPAIVEVVVRDEVKLEEGMFAYDNWKKSLVPLNFHVYLYNITNINKLDTERIKIEQVGPYVYQEDRYKEEVSFYPNGTVGYMEHKGYIFQRDKSAGDETDVINTVNVGVLGISAVISGVCDMLDKVPIDIVGCTCRSLVKTILDDLLEKTDEKFYTTAKITEFVFTGAPVNLFEYLAECMKDPMECIKVRKLIEKVKNAINECNGGFPWRKRSTLPEGRSRLLEGEEKTVQENILEEVSKQLQKAVKAELSSEGEEGGLLPPYIPKGVFAMLYGSNNSQDGSFLVNDGVMYSEEFTEIVKYKSSEHLEYWGDWNCNQVNGTDGVQFPPYIEEEDVLYVFSSDVCRSLYLTFEQDVKIEDVNLKAMRFVTPERMMDATLAENQCFACKYPGCQGDGIVDMTACQDGAPILMSPPHFYMADKKFLEPFEYFSTDEGKPSKSSHETFLDIDQKTGTTLRAHKRIQINFFVANNTPNVEILHHIKTLQDFPEGIVFPVMWFDETATIDESSADEFKKEVIVPVRVATAMGYVILGIGVILTVAGAIYCYKMRKDAKKSGKRNMLHQQSSTADLIS